MNVNQIKRQCWVKRNSTNQLTHIRLRGQGMCKKSFHVNARTLILHNLVYSSDCSGLLYTRQDFLACKVGILQNDE